MSCHYTKTSDVLTVTDAVEADGSDCISASAAAEETSSEAIVQAIVGGVTC